MKRSWLLLPVMLILFISACTDKGTTATNEMTETDDTPGLQTETITVTGSYRSVAGVMNPLSCACSEGGYVIDSETKEDVPVCFDGLAEDVRCGTITVSGKMTSQVVESEGNSPCPDGIQTFLQVHEYSCE